MSREMKCARITIDELSILKSIDNPHDLEHFLDHTLQANKQGRWTNFHKFYGLIDSMTMRFSKNSFSLSSGGYPVNDNTIIFGPVKCFYTDEIAPLHNNIMSHGHLASELRELCESPCPGEPEMSLRALELFIEFIEKLIEEQTVLIAWYD